MGGAKMKVIKRDGHIVDYCPDKIEAAISKANAEVAEEDRVTETQIKNIIKDIEIDGEIVEQINQQTYSKHQKNLII